jgi:hypothetical protein
VANDACWDGPMESRLWGDLHDIIVCDNVANVCQWFAVGRWFSPGTPVSSTNKTGRHDITLILWKVALRTIAPHMVER